MSSEFTFFRVYKDIANNRYHIPDVFYLYLDLKEKAQGTDLEKWFEKSETDLTNLDMIVAVDAVAHAIHQEGDDVLQQIFPGADSKLAKRHLDELSGLEKSNEIRKVNRGFYSTLLDDDEGFTFLEKTSFGVAGRATKEEIVDAIKEYEMLFRNKMASPGEILTLNRYYPDNEIYRMAVTKLNLDSDDDYPIVIGGPASVEMVDQQNHLITSEALKDAFERYMKNLRLRNVQILHCLAPGTKVWKRGGYTPIEQIEVGDKVITHEGRWRKVLKTMNHDLYEDILKVTLKNGEIIHITSEHRVFIKDGWKEIGQLKVGDIVLTANTSGTIKVNDNRKDWENLYKEKVAAIVHNGTEIVSIEPSEYRGKIYNLEVEEDNSFAGKGIIYHNSNVQAAWALPAYINAAGEIYKSGVDEHGFWLLAELRDDIAIAKRIREQVEKGKIRSYSIAGSATETQNIQKGLQNYMRVDKMDLAEITLCLVKNTKIQTDQGLKPIETIQIGDRVLTHKGRFSRVSNTFERQIDEEVIHFETGQGKELVLTSEHPVLTFTCEVCDPTGGWKKAEDLHEGDLLETSSRSTIVTSISKERYSGMVYNLEVEDDNSYATEAAIVHNCEKGVNQGAHFDILKSTDPFLSIHLEPENFLVTQKKRYNNLFKQNPFLQKGGKPMPNRIENFFKWDEMEKSRRKLMKKLNKDMGMPDEKECKDEHVVKQPENTASTRYLPEKLAKLFKVHGVYEDSPVKPSEG